MTQKFEYKKRNMDQIKKRATQAGGRRDQVIKDDFKIFTPKDKDNRLRILPPTWEGADHYGYDIYVHYGIGPDNGQYLCLAKMKNAMCPICEEKRRAEEDNLPDYAKELNPTKRVAVWLIDRDFEEDGPKIWSMPWTIDRDISKQAVDERQKEFLSIDDPNEGYDIEFERKGKGIQTEFVGLKIARRPSSMGKEEWLQYVVAHPIPNCLNFQEYEYVQNVFNAKPAPNANAEVKAEPKQEVKAEPKQEVKHEPKQQEPAPQQPKAESVPEFTYEQISKLDQNDLMQMAIEYQFISSVEAKIFTKDQLLHRICTKGNIPMKTKEPAKEPAKVAPPSWKDRLKSIPQEEGV